MLLFTNLIAVLGLLLPSLTTAWPQAPNTVAGANPSLRTFSTNSTYFILALPVAAVAQLVAPYKLIPVPTADTSLFPSGFPANTHPVIVATGLSNDIRQGWLRIPTLMAAQIQVPYTDRLGDGRTPFLYPAQNYIGGSGQSGLLNWLSGLVPSIVGTVGGTPIIDATFVPDNAAFKILTSNPLLYSAQVIATFVPNFLSGPGIEAVAIDTVFSPTTTPRYHAHTYHAMINQAQILTTPTALGMCQRNTIYFTEDFANPFFVKGKVTLYPGPVPKAIAGTFQEVEGYSATGEEIGNNMEDCATAAGNVDPAALN